MHVFWGYFLRLCVGLFELKYKPICVYLEISYLESWMKNSLQNLLLNLIWANRARTMGHPIRMAVRDTNSFHPTPFQRSPAINIKPVSLWSSLTARKDYLKDACKKGSHTDCLAPPPPYSICPPLPLTPHFSLLKESGGGEKEMWRWGGVGKAGGKGWNYHWPCYLKGPGLSFSLSLLLASILQLTDKQTDRQTHTHKLSRQQTNTYANQQHTTQSLEHTHIHQSCIEIIGQKFIMYHCPFPSSTLFLPRSLSSWIALCCYQHLRI